MITEDSNNFRYLNDDNRWRGFGWKGLERCSDGALRLCSLPLIDAPLPQALASLASSNAPAGIAVDVEGAVYFSDTQSHRILKIDACDGAQTLLSCLGGEGGEPARFSTPRGLLIPCHRRSLFVADSGNHRIQVFDLASLQLVDIWGQESLSGKPKPEAEPGLFDTPWALAGDPEGNVYVVDYGNHRVQKFNALGELVPNFWKNMQMAGIPAQPIEIATAMEDENICIYVLDGRAGRIGIFDSDGRKLGLIESEHLLKPLGIAAGNNAIYVGDNEGRRVLVFKKRAATYEFAGEAVGYEGPISALALETKGHLLVHSGSTLAPVRLKVDKGYCAKGFLWSDVIETTDRETQWHALSATMERLPVGAHIQFLIYTADDKNDTPWIDPECDNPFSQPSDGDQPGWRPVAQDVSDFIITGTGRCLWIGAVLLGNSRSTPVLSQLKVTFNHETYLRYLPQIYNKDATCGGFLRRFLSLFETFFDEVEEEIASLPALFDPEAASKDWLPWLAVWLALEFDENWDEAQQRGNIAKAFERYARRGTAEGIRLALRDFAGVHCIVEEPLLNSVWWSLPVPADVECCERSSAEWPLQTIENSVLGFTTRLASADPQGAVVGTTAILDQSHLITREEYGAPLFIDVAHQFSVLLYRGELKRSEILPRIREIIEREKPAHTAYHLCVIEPRMRIGFQARIGIDAVIGGPPPVLGLGTGRDLRLSGTRPSRIGEQSRVGFTSLG